MPAANAMALAMPLMDDFPLRNDGLGGTHAAATLLDLRIVVITSLDGLRRKSPLADADKISENSGLSAALVSYRRTLGVLRIESGGAEAKKMQRWSRRNDLNPWGSLTSHPQRREHPGGCESADHPKNSPDGRGVGVPI